MFQTLSEWVSEREISYLLAAPRTTLTEALKRDPENLFLMKLSTWFLNIEVGLSQILIPLGYNSQFHCFNISTNPFIRIALTLFRSQHRFILSEKIEYTNEGWLGLLWSQTYCNLMTCKFPPLHSFSHEVNALKQDSILREELKGHKHVTMKQTAAGKWPVPKLTSSCFLYIHSIKTINFRRTVWVISLGILESTIKTFVGLEFWMWFCPKQKKWNGVYMTSTFSLKEVKRFHFVSPPLL